MTTTIRLNTKPLRSIVATSRHLAWAVGVVIACGAIASELDAQERRIHVAVTVRAPLERVWELWTTNEGVRSFFAPGSNIDAKVDGMYELFFAPSAPVGQRGAEGMRLLVVEPRQRIAFTWNAPASLAEIREQRTVVTVTFDAVGADSTLVTLRHTGWGAGPQWEKAIGYFEQAWNGFVMPSFRYRVEHGPINWSSPPKLTPVHATAIVRVGVTRY